MDYNVQRGRKYLGVMIYNGELLPLSLYRKSLRLLQEFAISVSIKRCIEDKIYSERMKINASEAERSGIEVVGLG